MFLFQYLNNFYDFSFEFFPIVILVEITKFIILVKEYMLFQQKQQKLISLFGNRIMKYGINFKLFL